MDNYNHRKFWKDYILPNRNIATQTIIDLFRKGIADEQYGYRIINNGNMVRLVFEFTGKGYILEAINYYKTHILDLQLQGYDIDKVVEYLNKLEKITNEGGIEEIFIESIEEQEWFDIGEFNDWFISEKEEKKKREKQKTKLKQHKKIDNYLELSDINTISIIAILDKLGIEYKKHGNNIVLYNNGHYTDGWRGNIQKNIVNDFSGGRATGGPFNFVKTHLGLTNGETYNWFRENFY